MKRLLIAAAVAATILAPPVLAADVGVSVSVGQPGFFGRLDVGGYPQPEVYYRRPVVIERVEDSREPIYMRVPQDHAQHWKRHCGEYSACGERVLFVRDGWYNQQYAPHYQEQHRDKHDEHRDGHGNDHHGESNRER